MLERTFSEEMHMKQATYRLSIVACLSLGYLAGSREAIAQIVPDGTLPINSTIESTVTPDGNTLTIDGGTATGGNLFHSFQDFNVPIDDIAHFNNALTIDNIITRVTGGNISNIDGLIRANGTANLFLINPVGLVFGENASLDLGGSFVGSTAEALQFEDGSFYSAVDVDAPPLLTISVPVGLQFGAQPGGIRVEGGGHNLRFVTLPFALEDSPDVLLRRERPPGLQVSADRTLALVGGEINMMGGNLTAESGRIELGSVAGNGTVTLDPIASGWQLGYNGVEQFGDIRLSDASSLDTSGPGSGAVQIQGRSLSLRDGSAIVATTFGDKAGEDVTIRTTESIEFIGTTPDVEMESGIRAEVEFEATGSGGNVRIQTEHFLARDGAAVSVSTRGGTRPGEGNAGNLRLEATDVTLSGIRRRARDGGRKTAGLFSDVLVGSTGESGNINIQTERLRVTERASISASTLSQGDAGNITIRAGESIEVSNVANLRSVVGANAQGEGGDLSLETDGLLVSDGANIATTTLGAGNAGDLEVNAVDILLSGERVVITRRGNMLSLPSRLEAAVGPYAIGNAGNLTVRTERLSIVNGARMSITLSGSGNFGNITLNATDVQLRNGSEITAEARNNSDGGNIDLDTQILVLDDSLINANAVEGRGGNVQITAQNIFTDRNSTITASSQLGIDGTITLNTPDIDPGSELLMGSVTPIDIHSLIGRNPCRDGQESQFINSGWGGLPPSVRESLREEEGFVELVKLDRPDDRPASDAIPPSQPTRLVEAQGWIIGDNDQVILTANPPNITPQGKSSVAPNRICQ